MKAIFKTTLYAVALLVSTAGTLSSCRPEDGSIGPQGAPGDAGPAGATGVKGQTGRLYHRGGFIAGTITGTGKDGVTPIQEAFRYEFSENGITIFNESSGRYYFGLTRFDSVNVGSTYFSFSTTTDFGDPRFSYGTLNYYKREGEARYKQLNGYLELNRAGSNPPGSVHNLRYDRASGTLSGDYAWEAGTTAAGPGNQYISRSSTGKPFRVAGTFSINVRKGSY